MGSMFVSPVVSFQKAKVTGIKYAQQSCNVNLKKAENINFNMEIN